MTTQTRPAARLWPLPGKTPRSDSGVVQISLTSAVVSSDRRLIRDPATMRQGRPTDLPE